MISTVEVQHAVGAALSAADMGSTALIRVKTLPLPYAAPVCTIGMISRMTLYGRVCVPMVSRVNAMR